MTKLKYNSSHGCFFFKHEITRQITYLSIEKENV